MYEERRETFSIKDIILQILLIVLFVLLLVWIFPTKGYMRKFFNTNTKGETTDKVDASADASDEDINSLAVLYNQIFAENIRTMKEAAVGYYTNERLPQKVGDTDKLTLNDMYDKHLVLKLTDKDGNACDGEKSYVSITKYDEEYQMKVNLSCGNQEDYIIVYLGCYDYCDATGVCEKQVSTSNPTPKPTPTPTPSSKPTPTPSKRYVCEYKKVTGGSWGDYGEWSDWTTTPLTSNENTQVETKTEKEITGYTTEKIKVGTKTETYLKGYDEQQYISGYKTETYLSGYTVKTYVKDYKVQKYITGYKNEKYIKDYVTQKYVSGHKTEKYLKGYKMEKYISEYVTKKVKTGTQKVQVGTTTKTTNVKVAAGTTKKYVSSGSGSTVPSNGNGYIYIQTGSKTSQSCSSCATKTVYTWDKYAVVQVYKTEKRTEKVPVYEEQAIYETTKVPVYATRKVEVYDTREVEIYSTKKVPVYSVKKTPIYGTKKIPIYAIRKLPAYSTRKVPVFSTKKVPVYGTKETSVYEERKVPNYKTVIYYRSRTREYVGGTEDIKWSTCDPVDQKLVAKGYKLTGKKKEA